MPKVLASGLSDPCWTGDKPRRAEKLWGIVARRCHTDLSTGRGVRPQGTLGSSPRRSRVHIAAAALTGATNLALVSLGRAQAAARHDESVGRGHTPLALAAGHGDLELVKVFLDAGADVNDGTVMPNAGDGKATALTNAVWGGHKEVVELLLRRGASTDVVGGKFYKIILDYARANSPPEIMSLLENPPWNATIPQCLAEAPFGGCPGDRH
jgi:hypothetical protein